MTSTAEPVVVGVDSSTQSCKVVACDLATGSIVASGCATHPDRTEVDPAAWWDALSTAGDGLIGQAAVLAVGGQQHGMVALDDEGEVVRPALLWNDNRSAGAARALTAELGGQAAWADAIGTTLVASITVTKLRWLAEHEPDAAARVASVMLPHDWLTWRLGGEAEPTTDRGDASGTGYWCPTTGEYRADLLRLAFGRELAVPRVAAPTEIVATMSGADGGVAIAAGTGDNMAAALGLGLEPGDVVISLGTSGTVFTVSEHPTADPTGYVAGFADATGRYLPLVCTLNAARVLEATAAMLGTDLDGLSDLALAAAPGSGGLTLLPYLDGERTPALPEASGTLLGIRRTNLTPQNVARAAIEGMLCGLADGLDALRNAGVTQRKVLLIGGAARSPAVRAVAAQVLGCDVEVPTPGEYVAIGAARQAAWALTGEFPEWQVTTDHVEPCADAASGDAVRSAYAAGRTTLHGS